MKSEVTMADGRKFVIDLEEQATGAWKWSIRRAEDSFRMAYGSGNTLKKALTAAHNSLVDDVL